MNKQTVTNWLEEEFIKLESTIGVHAVMYELLERAKEMEKQQIEDAFCDGVDDEYEHHINNNSRKNSEKYYNETYIK